MSKDFLTINRQQILLILIQIFQISLTLLVEHMGSSEKLELRNVEESCSYSPDISNFFTWPIQLRTVLIIIPKVSQIKEKKNAS